MIWKRIKQASPPSDQTWKQIDQTPIPLSSGRIWLADKDGNVTRGIGLDVAHPETPRAAQISLVD
jgi:hypothetical protein